MATSPSRSETTATPQNAEIQRRSRSRRRKEVEQKLRQVEQFWSVAVLEMARHKDTEVNVIVSPDDLIETLDEHNIQLQSPRAASHVGAFTSMRLVSIRDGDGWSLVQI